MEDKELINRCVALAMRFYREAEQPTEEDFELLLDHLARQDDESISTLLMAYGIDPEDAEVNS